MHRTCQRFNFLRTQKIVSGEKNGTKEEEEVGHDEARKREQKIVQWGRNKAFKEDIIYIMNSTVYVDKLNLKNVNWILLRAQPTQPLMILRELRKKHGVKWQILRRERDDRHTSSVRQRGRTGSCHLPLIAYVLGSPLRVHPLHSISHHQLSANVKTPRWVTMHFTEPRRDSRRERQWQQKDFDSSPHLKSTNTNIFSTSMACWLPGVSGDAPAELR